MAPAVLTPVAPDGGSAGSFPLRERLDWLSQLAGGHRRHGRPRRRTRGLARCGAGEAALVDAALRRRPDELDGLEKAVAGAGLDRAGYSIHLPLAGTDDARLAEVGRWLGRLESSGRRTASCG